MPARTNKTIGFPELFCYLPLIHGAFPAYELLDLKLRGLCPQFIKNYATPNNGNMKILNAFVSHFFHCPEQNINTLYFTEYPDQYELYPAPERFIRYSEQLFIHYIGYDLCRGSRPLHYLVFLEITDSN